MCVCACETHRLFDPTRERGKERKREREKGVRHSVCLSQQDKNRKREGKKKRKTTMENKNK